MGFFLIIRLGLDLLPVFNISTSMGYGASGGVGECSVVGVRFLPSYAEIEILKSWKTSFTLLTKNKAPEVTNVPMIREILIILKRVNFVCW